MLELPIESVVSGAAWPYVEAPRELAAVRDGRPRVNGYSGFEPKHFDAIAAELDRFPAPGALAEAQRLGVRYVVLRTQLVGTVTPAALGRQLARDGVGLYSLSTARRIVDALPTAAVASVDSLPGGYLIELRT